MRFCHFCEKNTKKFFVFGEKNENYGAQKGSPCFCFIKFPFSY